MKKIVHLYWQEECFKEVEEVAKVLQTHFPATVIAKGVREPSRRAFDTARGNYDAFYLLRELPETELVLWLIKEDISYAGYDFLYGAAWQSAAVVSAARIGFSENLQKEACHEFGHLLGLEHCKNSCLMGVSSDLSKLSAKPLSLCEECSSQFEPECAAPAKFALHSVLRVV